MNVLRTNLQNLIFLLTVRESFELGKKPLDLSSSDAEI
jgi:hypothetical protein